MVKKEIECPFHENHVMAELTTEPKELEYMGVMCPILIYSYKCPQCGEQFTTNEIDELSLKQVPDYWRKHYIVPERIASTKANVIKCLKDYNLLYNSVHVINSEDGSNQPVEVYINNSRVWSASELVEISYEECELFLGKSGADWWNRSGGERADYIKYNPFSEKKLPKEFK